MQNIIDYLTELATSVGVKIVFGLVVLFVGMKLSKFLIKVIAKGKGFSKLEASAQGFVKSFLKIVLYALVISSAAMIWGIPATSFMTVFASAGVAIGLALQGALSNFAGGLMILFFKPFKVGDFIESGSYSGVVRDITVIYTILTTGDNKDITIPNGSLTNSSVVNYSVEPLRRVDMTFSADYNSDVERVKELLTEVAKSHPKVKADQGITARLLTQGSSSLDYALRVWCSNADYWDVYFDINEQVKKVFDSNNISIPYPQLDVHVSGKE